MRSSVDAAAFYKAMTALMDIPAKSPVKVLQEIKVEFTADHCTLSATNFNTWLSVTIPASGDDFAFVFWNSAGVQKVCRYFTGQLELELSGQRKSQIITIPAPNKAGKPSPSKSPPFSVKLRKKLTPITTYRKMI